MSTTGEIVNLCNLIEILNLTGKESELCNYYILIYPSLYGLGDGNAADDVGLFLGSSITNTDGSIRSTSEFEDHNHWPCRYALDKTYPFLNADFLAWGAVETHYALVEVLVYKIPAEYHAVNDIIAVGA